MTHADKEFYYASRNLALEIKGNFIGGNTRHIPLNPLEFQSHSVKKFNSENILDDFIFSNNLQIFSNIS